MNTIRSAMVAVMFALPLAAAAADGLGGAKVQGDAPDAKPRRELQRPQCEGTPEQCREQTRARVEERCRENPQPCAEMKAKLEQRRTECQADPEKCREQARAQMRERLRKADTDGNGTISRAEAGKGLPAISRHFDEIDANGDGQITREELEAAHAKRGAQKGVERGPRSPSSGPGALPAQRSYDV
jgi:hypothetical protein